ncbi:hypothetical protein LINPERHAP2_LOCUS41072 [Linum perenne]
MGEACGGFVEYDAKRCSLSSVRLKVVVSSELPTSIKFWFLRETFVVRVVVKSQCGGPAESVRITQVLEEPVETTILCSHRLEWNRKEMMGKAKVLEEGESSSAPHFSSIALSATSGGFGRAGAVLVGDEVAVGWDGGGDPFLENYSVLASGVLQKGCAYEVTGEGHIRSLQSGSGLQSSFVGLRFCESLGIRVHDLEGPPSEEFDHLDEVDSERSEEDLIFESMEKVATTLDLQLLNEDRVAMESIARVLENIDVLGRREEDGVLGEEDHLNRYSLFFRNPKNDPSLASAAGDLTKLPLLASSISRQSSLSSASLMNLNFGDGDDLF